MSAIFPIAVPEFDRSGLMAFIDAHAEADRQCTFGASRAERVYAPEIGEALLREMLPAVQALVPDRIVPSHAYARLAHRDTEMREHVDRPGLDWSVTVNVRRDAPWDLEILEGKTWRKFPLDDPSEGLLYDGRALRHRRAPYAGERAYQLFLHYTRKDDDDMDQGTEGPRGVDGMPGGAGGIVRVQGVLTEARAAKVAAWVDGALGRDLGGKSNRNAAFNDRSVALPAVDDPEIAGIAAYVRDMVCGVGQAVWSLDALYPSFTDLVTWPEGSELGWHTDSAMFPERAVTGICGLDNGWTGGETEIELPGGTQTFRIGVGELVVYLSSWNHRVLPVVGPTRHTIACWATEQRGMMERGGPPPTRASRIVEEPDEGPIG